MEEGGSQRASGSDGNMLKYATALGSVSWRQVNSPYGGRDGHCACAVGGRMYVFGGVVQTANDEHEESCELLVFEPGWCLCSVRIYLQFSFCDRFNFSSMND